MRLILISVACAIGLVACKSSPPIAYCPAPPTPPKSVTDRLIDEGGVEGFIFLNDYRKHMCKYWSVYDPEEFKDKQCPQSTQ